MQLEVRPPELSESDFEKVRALLYRIAGIDLNRSKMALVSSRLIKRVRRLGFSGFEEYIRHVEKDGTRKELRAMIDIMTTNKTGFFREAQHFDYLRRKVVPRLGERSASIRLWSAGCSSGQEPYTLGIVLREFWPEITRCDVKILATDISDQMLDRARLGRYSSDEVREVPPSLLKKYFSSEKNGSDLVYTVSEEIKSLVRFARLNLFESWAMKGPFDVILCRNVMIYFDKRAREELVGRFWRMLASGGILLVGLSESLVAVEHAFHYKAPAIYEK